MDGLLAHQILLLLLIGYIVYTIDIKKNYFPVPVVLVLIGIGLSFIPFFSELDITKDIIFTIFLPAILFTSAYQFPIKQVKQNAGLIAALSTLGLMATALLLGLGIYWVSGFSASISLTAAFLLAAILIPTDPVSITSILKQSKGEEKIADVVEGESMVNDGTSVVIFTILLAMFQTGSGFSPGKFIFDFLLVSLGGIAIGWFLGWLMSKIIHYTDNRHYQVMLTIIVAYGSFYLAEALGVSGVLATVAAGILLAYEFGKNIKDGKIQGSLDGFWNIINPALLGLLFLLIGIQGAEYLAFSKWRLAVGIFFLSILARFLVLAGFIYGVPAWRKEFTNDFSTTSLITWSGIKGAMSVALLLWFENEAAEKDELLVSLAFAVILLSLVIQSVGVYPLTKLIKKQDK